MQRLLVVGWLFSGVTALTVLTMPPIFAESPDRLLSAHPIFSLPVDCPMGTKQPGECTIHKYVDHDPSPGRKDYSCGRLSLDGDTGTDFRTPSFVEMHQGVAVLAAADGLVRATRDGMVDVSVRKTGVEAVKGREAGNSVVVQHGNGWETQYSHLKKGSVQVKRGDRVKRGDPLGAIGLSGRTEFPHVEFSVRKDGLPIDPFVGFTPFVQPKGANPRSLPGYECGEPRSPLWSDDALDKLSYQASGVLSIGMAKELPEINAARDGGYADKRFSSSSAALVVWADIFGAQAGDLEQFLIAGPNGEVIHKSETTLEKSNISWFTYFGKRRPPNGWVTGRYQASYRLSRRDQTVAERSVLFEVLP